MANCRKYKPTYILIALNVAFYICTSIISGNFIETGWKAIYVFGQVNAFVFEGWYWQLFTSMFVHASIFHLVCNMLFLFIFGLRSEELFSLPEYLGIYLLGGLTGNLLSLFLLPLYTPSVGASGAIFSIFGACIIYNRRSFRQSIIGALAYAFFMLIISSGLGVNNYAHIGGLAIGLLIGYMLASKHKPTVEYSYTTPL